MTLRQKLNRARLSRALGAPAGPFDIEIRQDLRVPMDDGVELLADLISPVGETDPRLPTVVIRGPYGRRGRVATEATALAHEGFTVLFQSCRGTWGSPGTFRPQLDEQADGIATHRWVRAQPWFTGTIATYGASYMGYTQWAVAGHLLTTERELAPDALSLVTTMPDFGAETWQHGAFALRNSLTWSRMMTLMARGGAAMIGILLPGKKLVRGYAALPLGDGDTVATGAPVSWYQDWLTHEDLRDDYWTQQSHTASVADVGIPVSMTTGWYDIFLPAQLRNHATLVARGNAPQLTIGPWGHVSKALTPAAIADTVSFLKATFTDAANTRPAPVRAYQTGAEEWHDLATWPPAAVTTRPHHLRAGGHLTAEPPAGDSAPTSYAYDPTAPTPSVGGPSLDPDSEPVDNAAHERRDDVVIFTAEPVSAPIDLAGEPVAHIRFRSSATSADIFVRLCDVHPDGRSITVCDGIRRIGGRGTAGLDPEPDADGILDVEVRLWPTYHRVLPGHRLRLQVSSGAYPRYARNLGSAEPALSAAEPHVATQEVFHDAVHASRIDLPVRTQA